VGEKGQNNFLGIEQWILAQEKEGDQGSESMDEKMVMIMLIV
jgi:hypothetical protein